MSKVTFILTATLLTGCAVPNEIAKPPLPADYRQLVADQLPTIKGISLAGAAISGLGPSIGGQPGDWTTCLKISGANRPRFFAIFLSNIKQAAGAVSNGPVYAVDVRESILADHCEVAIYGPLPSKKLKSAKDNNSK